MNVVAETNTKIQKDYDLTSVTSTENAQTLARK